MSYFPEIDRGLNFAPFQQLREHFGIVPGLFRSQTLRPEVIEAETELLEAILLRERSLRPEQKATIALVAAAARRNGYCVAMHYQRLRELGTREEDLLLLVELRDRVSSEQPEGAALLDFAKKLSLHAGTICRADFETLSARAIPDDQVLETLLVTALGVLLCTLATGLGVKADFDPPAPLPNWDGQPSTKYQLEPRPFTTGREAGAAQGPRLCTTEPDVGEFPPFDSLRLHFGFVPGFFQAQAQRTDVLTAEVRMLESLLFQDGPLSRLQRSCILLAVSAGHFNIYWVTLLSERLRILGLSEDETRAISRDHSKSHLSGPDKALLDAAIKLTTRPSDFSRLDIDRLGALGVHPEQVIECIATAALADFLHTLQAGLGTAPDFEAAWDYLPEVEPQETEALPDINNSNPFPDEFSLTNAALDSQAGMSTTDDPDSDLVLRVQQGEMNAFEELVNRHNRKIYRILLGITGKHEEAEDGVQETFLKAFEHMGSFKGRSRFSTWLIRIAMNAGVQRMRRSRNMESLDEGVGEDDETFRPRQLRAWTDDPEQLYSKEQRRSLVERGLKALPQKYRMAVILRDIEQLSTEEAAQALQLGVPALKSRLLRGRLMLREALAPYFARGQRGGEGV
ncbi:MAG: sigma-70 family RNA polymerase sigma factor [Acidobacteria bacterium]|nr:sigma-70 family RNA polymerase sigma factor [Acidobacteriota bacterium]